MSAMLTINISSPIASVEIPDGHSEPVGDEHIEKRPDAGAFSREDVDAQKVVFVQTCAALNRVIDKLNEFCDKIFAAHREEIAHLSVEIARKILMHKVTNGDYEIEAIVKEAIGNAPGRQDLTVHLNPDDLAQCRKAQEAEPHGVLAGIKLVSDSNIGRAECLLESPKGIVKSLIEENLERITRALGQG